MTSPAPGWYPDPGGAAPYRWWDGQAWTTATSHGTPPPAAQVPAPGFPTTASAAPTYGGTGQPGSPAGAQAAATATPFGTPDAGNAAASGPTTAYGTRSPFDPSGGPAAGTPSDHSALMSTARMGGDSLWHKNQTAMWTFIVVAIYIFIALSTGFGIIGFVPAALAWRSHSRNEPLAPLAIGAAVIAVVVGVTTFTHH